MQKLVKTGKNTEIKKQSDVKFWLNWIKFSSFLIFIKLYLFDDFLWRLENKRTRAREKKNQKIRPYLGKDY